MLSLAFALSLIFAFSVPHDGGRCPDTAFKLARSLSTGRELYLDDHDPIAAFGNSRRICPGRHSARDMLWLAVLTRSSKKRNSKSLRKNTRSLKYLGETFVYLRATNTER